MPERAVSEADESQASEGLPRRSASQSGPVRRPTVSVVIPAKNEARNLGHVLASIPPWVDEIVLVDGHSTDDTAAVARKLNPSVKIVAQQGRGKGDALRAGFAACESEIIIMMDADGSTDGAEIPGFVQALVEGADFAKGSRFAKGGASDDITATRRYGNSVLIALVNLLFGTRYTDLCYGYNGFWKRNLPVLDLDCAGFEVESVMNIRAAKAGLWIREVPSHEHARMHGESNLHVIRDGWRIAKVIARERLLRRGRVHPPQSLTRVCDVTATAANPGGKPGPGAGLQARNDREGHESRGPGDTDHRGMPATTPDGGLRRLQRLPRGAGALPALPAQRARTGGGFAGLKRRGLYTSAC